MVATPHGHRNLDLDDMEALAATLSDRLSGLTVDDGLPSVQLSGLRQSVDGGLSLSGPGRIGSFPHWLFSGTVGTAIMYKRWHGHVMILAAFCCYYEKDSIVPQWKTSPICALFDGCENNNNDDDEVNNTNINNINGWGRRWDLPSSTNTVSQWWPVTQCRSLCADRKGLLSTEIVTLHSVTTVTITVQYRILTTDYCNSTVPVLWQLL